MFCEGRKLSRLLPAAPPDRVCRCHACVSPPCMIAFQASGVRIPNSLRPTLALSSPAADPVVGRTVRQQGRQCCHLHRNGGLRSGEASMDRAHSLSATSESNVFALQTFLIGWRRRLILLGAAVDEARHAETTTRQAEGANGLCRRVGQYRPVAAFGGWQGSVGDRTSAARCSALHRSRHMRWSDILNCTHPGGSRRHQLDA